MARWAVPDDLHSRISSGPICPFLDHSRGSLDAQVPRYDDSHACVRCISALTEGRLSLDIRRIHKNYRRQFLEFWSFVDIAGADSCWNWHGHTYSGDSSSYFPFRRHWGKGRQYSAPRVATWFTWGDIGRLPIEHVCGDKFCCNPLHIRVRGVPHFHHNRRLASIDLIDDSRRLRNETSEYLQVTRELHPRRYEKIEQVNIAWIGLRADSDGPVSQRDLAEERAAQFPADGFA
jgi:hypothetical protein